jgi:hypothetical protein
LSGKSTRPDCRGKQEIGKTSGSAIVLNDMARGVRGSLWRRPPHTKKTQKRTSSDYEYSNMVYEHLGN